MKKLYTLLMLPALLLLANSCNEDEQIEEWIAQNPLPEPPVVEPGSLDFSNYVALGNSLTAGFADGVLFPLGQSEAYPSVLARQFQAAGGGTFEFPDIVTGNGVGPDPFNPDALVGRSFADAALASDPDASLTDIIQFTEPGTIGPSSVSITNLNNFGVPGIRLADINTDGFSNFYYDFYGATSGSVVDNAVAANPTFFSVWLGSNDVLGFAIEGGGGLTPITDPATFQTEFTTMLTALVSTGAEGVVLNIPPITIIPFFQFVTLATGIELIALDQATADAVNAGYAAYNGGLQAAVDLGFLSEAERDQRMISFTAGNNAPVVIDNDLTDLTFIDEGLINMRQAVENELFPLTAATVIGQPADPMNPDATVQGVAVPIPDEFFLTNNEIVEIITAYATYNEIIAGVVAATPGVELVDVRPLFADVFGLTPEEAGALQLGADAIAAADGVEGTIRSGINLIPLSIDENEIFNSIFSTDLIHPNGRGQSLIANEIIEVINERFGASIQTVDVLDASPVNVTL